MITSDIIIVRRSDMSETKKAYKRFYAPNKERLAELVEKAIGPNRNQTEFAKQIGVNPSTISRIINMKNSGASSDELILAIAANADPKSGVTEEMLMEANGMLMDANGMLTRLSCYARLLSDNYCESAIKKISMEILDRGYSVNRMVRRERYIISRGVPSLTADFVIETNAIEGTNNLWAFICFHSRSFSPVLGFRIADVEIEPTKKGKVAAATRALWDRISKVLAVEFAGNVSPYDIPEKFTIVFDDKEIYEYAKECYGKFRFPRLFSFLLLNQDSDCLEEFNCKRVDDFVGKDIFTPIERKPYYEDEDEFFYDDGIPDEFPNNSGYRPDGQK